MTADRDAAAGSAHSTAVRRTNALLRNSKARRLRRNHRRLCEGLAGLDLLITGGLAAVGLLCVSDPTANLGGRLVGGFLVLPLVLSYLPKHRTEMRPGWKYLDPDGTVHLSRTGHTADCCCGGGCGHGR
jgi:hypothetical protein